jgi:hypothetical protein
MDRVLPGAVESKAPAAVVRPGGVERIEQGSGTAAAGGSIR